MGLVKEVRDACWTAKMRMGALTTQVHSEIAKYEKDHEDIGEEFLIIKHGFDRAIEDAWKTTEEMRDLVLNHKGSERSLKWYNPLTWLGYAAGKGDFDRIVSSIDVHGLYAAANHVDAAMTNIGEGVQYFAGLVSKPEFDSARESLRRYRGGEIHATADPEMALSVLPDDPKLFAVQEAYRAAKLIEDVAKPIRDALLPIRMRAWGD